MIQQSACRSEGASLGIEPAWQHTAAPADSAGIEPPPAFWRDRENYDQRLTRDFIAPLRQAAGEDGHAPDGLQVWVLRRLHWYFTVDARDRAPTLVVDDALARTFHQRVSEVMRYVDARNLADATLPAATEVRHALLSYRGLHTHSVISLDAYDHLQGLFRLRYWVHGDPPAEQFTVDGRRVQPAFAKYRACRFFRRDLFRQRIVWLPAAADAASLEVRLDGGEATVAIGEPTFRFDSAGQQRVPNPVLDEARRQFPRGKGLPCTRFPAGWKARLMRAIARLPVVRRHFDQAWVFADREHDADDNAEHLYRWVRRNHPEINAWFLMQRGTPDWKRLADEGFRLMPPGRLRKLLILNSRHIVSSHPNYAMGQMDRRIYGDLMQWRFTYLKHGVVKDDQSHYYAAGEFDCVIAPSPLEYEAFVADDTPYQFTGREVRRCNLPRYDRLLELAKRTPVAEISEVLVMPTWRNSLVDDRFEELSFAERMARMASSDFVRAWRAVLREESVRAVLRSSGTTLVFLPHSNLEPYLDAFDIPPDVRVVTKGQCSIQERLARCCLFMTDYTSVAFDVALLRRGVVYYQFDRQRFYGGEHNWRPGYFDYERDGFGPVATTHNAVVRHLEDFFRQGGHPAPEYLARMERSLPDREPLACQRVYDAIVSLDRPFANGAKGGVEPSSSQPLVKRAR